MLGEGSLHLARYRNPAALEPRAIVALEDVRDGQLPIRHGRALDVDVSQDAVGLEVCLLAPPIQRGVDQRVLRVEPIPLRGSSTRCNE